MKKRLLIIPCIFIIYFSCTSAPFSKRKIASSEEMQAESSKQELIVRLKKRRNEIYKWALLCEGEFAGQASEFPGTCKQIDVTEFAGAACLSAELAGDKFIVKERCRDVSLGQARDGRWWRGQSNIEKQDENSFSRDMLSGVINYFISQGLISKDPKANLKAREQAIKWIEWIEKKGHGKKMCNDDAGFFNNRCSIKGSAVLYYTLKAIGAITTQNRNYKTIKKLKKSKGLNGWQFETFFTTAGFQQYLKSHKLYQKYLLGMINEKQYQRISGIIYHKNPLNPWHQFMFMGATKHTVERTLKLCPTKRPVKAQWTLPHYTTGDQAWQRDTDDKAWEVANGHDCIALINWELAALEKKIQLPWKTAKDTCGFRRTLAEKEGKKICKPYLLNNISRVACSTKNGIEWKGKRNEYCLQDKGKFYLAKDMIRECPLGHSLVGEEKGLPLCQPAHASQIRLFSCNRSGDGDMHGSANRAVKEGDKFKWCHAYKETWYQKKSIGSYCPPLTKFENEFVWSQWPVCKGLRRIKESKCIAPHIPKENYCLHRQKGWFSKRKYK